MVETKQLSEMKERLRVRAPRSGFAWMTLLRSVQMQGMLNTIKVVGSYPNGPFEVIDGAKRVYIAQKLGIGELRVEIISDNHHHGALVLLTRVAEYSLHPVEVGLIVDYLTSNCDYSSAQIAIKLGKSQAWVSHAKNLVQKAPPSLIAAIVDGALPPSTYSHGLATLIRKYELSDEQVDEFVKKVKWKSLSVSQLKEMFLQWILGPERIRDLISSGKIAAALKAISPQSSLVTAREKILLQVVYDLLASMEAFVEKTQDCRDLSKHFKANMNILATSFKRLGPKVESAFKRFEVSQ